LAPEIEVTATSELFARVSETPAVQTLARRLEAGGLLSGDGTTAGAQSFLAALARRLFPKRPILVVAEGLKTQEVLQQDITTWLGIESGGRAVAPLFYPAWEILPQDSRLPRADVISERLETLVTLSPDDSRARPETAPMIVTNVVALLQRTFPAETIRKRTRSFVRGDRIEPLDLVEWLEDQGYEPEAQVTQKGEIALRGGILDVYPPTSPWPVRLEFFGEELDSLRYFDPLTQISRDGISTVTIPPAGELGLLRSKPKTELGEVELSPEELKPTSELGSLLDYLPADTIILLCEPEQLAGRADEYGGQVRAGDPFYLPWEEFQWQAIARGMTLLSANEADAALIPVEADSGALSEPGLQSVPTALQFQSLEAFRPLSARAPEPHIAEAQRREFFAQLHRWLRQGHAVHVFCNNEGERQRFQEIWDEYGFDSGSVSGERPSSGAAIADAGQGLENSSGLELANVAAPGDRRAPVRPVIEIGALSRGFLCDEARLVVVTDAEIFGRYKVLRPRRLKSAHAQTTRSALDIDFTELEEGDYVVHLQHGIGRFVGLQVLQPGAGMKPSSGGSAELHVGQECLVIEYAPHSPEQPSPRLYVPVTEAHLVSKYVGTGQAHPPLNMLGGTRWAKAKEHAARAVRDVASELLAIQAARDSEAGHSFAADTTWQREFEGAFIFEETPDQMKAILETKADMERPKPMDRLICGDVGFGKTEVGIRAAFKAVMDGRQVAVLVPTTVLAQQHYNTFRERMADYPVRVELLSRFRTRAAQQRVVKDLAAGSADIVIGTHRLLQDDIAFKDLGLVVIDEEQRFGVLHKEKFKMLRKLVDVLTLSATPIPRTLYLALAGARDMSTIQTPPHDRLPVETTVTPYDERLIRDAIQRELNRGGQVFFLHNRVVTIEATAQKLRDLLPRARIIVGHGQMHSDELEDVMTKFVDGEADVLLSTTIIESGLDIPNANTIIVDRADRFGLSDLYQLRGRVGRYKHQAYAYLLVPRHAGMLADARKRLTAIKQYSTLGSGFKIAMRDLEIRGAGNLLGAEQSGHITAVGFELYCQLLKQSVASLKGEQVKPRLEVEMRLDFLALSPGLEERGDGEPGDGVPRAEPATPRASAFIPFKYASDPRQRIEIYRKLAQATEKAALQDLEKELRDRFGPLPPPLKLLLQVAELRILAGEKGVTSLEVKDDKLILTRNDDLVMFGNKFPRLTKREAGARVKEIKKLLLAI
jgi:transcription-repair coupling factor (superfamily II helicase)